MRQRKAETLISGSEIVSAGPQGTQNVVPDQKPRGRPKMEKPTDLIAPRLTIIPSITYSSLDYLNRIHILLETILKMIRKTQSSII
jgi:hypothetical protein